MTLSQLRVFVAVATNGSVRAAAEQLFVSQPAVSAAVAALQRELEVPLFTRVGRGLQLTPAGRIYARYARQVLGLLDEAKAAAVGHPRPERGRVRLAAVTTAGEHVLPRFLASFRAKYPFAELSLEVGNRSRVWDLLDHREVDLAVGGRPPGSGRFATLATRPNVLVLVARASPTPADGKRPPRARTVSRGTLQQQVLLVREMGSGTRSTAEEILEELGVSLPTLTLGSNGAIRESVQVGLGITLISRDAVARELEEGTLEEWRYRPIPLHRAWHVAARAGDQLASTAQLLLDHLIRPGQAQRGDRFHVAEPAFPRRAPRG